MDWFEKNLQENFDLPPGNSSEEALLRWRSAVSFVKNRRRRFRMVADLDSRSHDEARLLSVQESTIPTDTSDENTIKESTIPTDTSDENTIKESTSPTDTSDENTINILESTSPTDTSDENTIKGFINFIHTFTYVVPSCYGVLVTLSVAYLGSSKALVNYGDAGTIPILITNVMSLFLGSVILLPYAGHFKGAKSADHIGFLIFIGALLLWWLVFIIECCVTLHVYLKISNSVIWPVGTAVFCLTSFSKVAYLEYQRPKMRKWATNIWKKARYFFRDPKTILRQMFRQGEPISRPNV